MTKAGLSGERPAGAALTKPLSSQAHRAGRGWGRGINQFARSATEATEGLWGDKSHVKVFAKAARQERFHSSPALCLNSKSRPQYAKMQQDTQGGRKPPPEALGNQRGRVAGAVGGGGAHPPLAKRHPQESEESHSTWNQSHR